MPTAHQGSVYANHKPGRAYKVRFATPGFPFINAGTDYESINPGVRYSANVSFESAGPDVANGTSMLDGVVAMLNCESAQTTLVEVKNYYLQWQNPFQAQMQTVGGLWYNFTAEAGTLSTPTGTQLMGGTWEWTIDDERRRLALAAQTYLTSEEYELLLTQTSAAQLGGASGTALGLTDTSATDDNFRRAGFQDVTVNGVSIGVRSKGGNSITIRSAAQGSDHKTRPLNRFVETEAQFSMLQTSANDLKASLTDRQQNYSIIASTMAGETFKWTTTAASVDFRVSIGDDGENQVLRIKSRHPIISGVNAIDWGVGTATQVEFKDYAWA
jgi:hypothetical protein